MTLRPLLLSAMTIAILAACQREAAAPAPAPQTPETAAATPASSHAFDPAIRSEDFAELVKTLASDEFEGRAPGSAGEDKTVEYIKAQFERIGLKPGNGDSFFQTVPMTETTADESTTLKIDANGKPYELKFGTDMVIGTRTGNSEVKIDDSELVFVGYGVNAPELDWNDYEGLDVEGKTVVMLVNDPGFHGKDESLFEGKRMTYYGRWTYKFEEAARQGAAAAIIVHDTDGASYGWDVVKGSWSGAQFDLRAADDPAPRLPAQGWITADVAKKLFADAGLDLAEQYKAAGKRGFKSVPLNAKLSLDLKSKVSEKQSRNVVGVLPGSQRPDEAIVYMAHWDHLGKHDDEPGDNIYNGAVDNATGVAGIIEVAGAFAAQEPKPERSVVFLAVTLEESGLLGSKYYVAHPAFPLDKTVGVVNIDAMSVAGKSRDMTVVGFGSSELEDVLKPIAQQQGRSLHAETHPESGSFFRSDHFNFAKAGVPALYVDGGHDLVDGGKAAGEAAGKDYGDKRYHKPADEYDAATWKLDGTMQDLDVAYQVGRELAGSDRWPNWYEGNAFKAARDQMMQGKPAPQ
ncbi:Zn-dependent M28 family amino/carboxypeptidase [Luteimonas cucumeris]|uniref:Zn-dependent M28 family amino/carboxypeptidase n=1 Tax=Luteimonas cucumeris TaxID=985012 RepID=A0A562LE68_9GAMM|nr:M28 family metallopeptidase [Luteimonas cucumeris]TWI05856.1 Zn-dependent M28 family amino/carboxypeptidase [Luteimonas cucumeris]